MLLIAIDCSAAACSVAVLRDGDIVAGRDVEGAHGHAARIIGMIDDTLTEAGVAADALPDALDEVLVTAGPGSFTGIRVGLAAAKGLVVATGATGAAVAVPEVLRASIDPEDIEAGTAVLAVIDSRRGDVFAQAFAPDGKAAGDIVVADHPALAAMVAALDAPVHIVGDAAEAVASGLREAGHAHSIAATTPRGPTAMALGRLRQSPGWPAIRQPLRPIYARAPEIGRPGGQPRQ